MRPFVVLAWIPLAVAACDPVNQPMAHPRAEPSPSLADAGASEAGAVSPAPTITASPSDIEI